MPGVGDGVARAGLADVLDVSVDYLLEGTTHDAARADFEDRELLKMFKEVERGTDEKKTYDFPRFFNLYSDPKEEYPLTKATAGHFWVRWPMGELLAAHSASLQKEPPIRPGTPDPYEPNKG